MNYWWNEYVGIHYQEKGRAKDGADCWGLVRLVYQEQFNIALPTLLDEYETADKDSIAELVSITKEGWNQVDNPSAGDVVVFNIIGQPVHVGIVTSPGMFLHVRRDQEAVIERLTTGVWKHRIVGFYKYEEKKDNAISFGGLVHPLRTERIDGVVPEGLSISEIVNFLAVNNNLNTNYDALIMLNGKVIPKAEWEIVIPNQGSRIEYRAIAGDDNTWRILATIAVIVASYYIPGFFNLSGWQAFAASASINIAGSYLINSIFPIRPAPTIDTNIKQQNLLQGGSNQANQYGAIPVVLGQYRYTPPLGSVNYVEANASTSFLKMLLVWGYGKLQVSDLRVGDVALNSLEQIEYETLNDYDGTQDSTSKFNKIYGQDVSQEFVNVKLECSEKTVSSATRTSGVLTVNTSTAHGMSSGWFARVYTGSTTVAQGTITYVDADTFTLLSAGTDGSVTANSTTGSPWTEKVIADPCDKVTVTLHFPEGLRAIVLEGGNAGKTFETYFRAQVQVRQLNPITLYPLTNWGDVDQVVNQSILNFDNAFFNIDNDEQLEPVYRWSRISLNSANKIIVRTGAFTTSVNADPSGNLLTRLQNASFGFNNVYTRLPDLPAGEEELWQVCVYGNNIYSTVDKRGLGTASVTGCNLTMTGLQGTIASGTITRAQVDLIRYGGAGEPYCKRKDAFSVNISFDVPNGPQEVRVRRTNDSEKEYVTTSGNKATRFHDCYFVSVTGYENTRPVVPPKNLVMTAIRVQATNQLNGNIDGISGIVTSVCKDYDIASGKTYSVNGSNVCTVTYNGHPYAVGNTVVLDCTSGSGIDGTYTITEADINTFKVAMVVSTTSGNVTVSADPTNWVTRPTRNPASLFRYVLQHPANAQAVGNSQIDLPSLIDWHAYCKTNKFMFDSVIADQKSLLDVLRDVCAAGRASPTIRDGKWTVIIDRPNATISQFFTPSNSWGFESTKGLPNIPHAFRVQFTNSKKGYIQDEMIVYNDGYSSSNATKFEGLTLPGVTTTDQIFKHARYHLAQLKLRPEKYTLNVDMEHLICTRGDRVKVTHDVPLWGLATGRIKNRNSGTELELDNLVPMDASTQYTIRIRLADGTSITRTVAAKLADGYYSTITLTSSVTTTQGAGGNLFMFGALNSESVDLVVQTIEPTDNYSARVTLVDYAEAIYSSDSETVPAFDSQITLPPIIEQSVVTVKPTISELKSDESVIVVISPGQYQYRIKVSFVNAQTVPKSCKFVEGQIVSADDSGDEWEGTINVSVNAAAIYFNEVEEGESYKMRLRYVTSDGRVGPWQNTVNHTVVGRTNPPSQVGVGSLSIKDGKLFLSWPENPEIDIANYEVRTSDSNWGSSGFIFQGKAASCYVEFPIAGTSTTWYIKAIDTLKLYSETARSVSYTLTAPANPATLTATFSDTALTNATITLDWPDVTSNIGLDYYKVQYSTITKTVKASTITLPADWLGSRTFIIKTVDILGNESSGINLAVTKLVPNPVTNLRAQVIDNNVLLYWDLPSKTTLPIQNVEVRKGATWASATVIGTKAGGFTTLQELTANTYTYWVAVNDTDNNQSTPVSISAKVSAPPDFVFHAEFASSFTGTLSSAIVEQSNVVIPVNTSETWAQHFTTRSWNSPDDQIAAGYPIYIQPTPSSGYYEEVFDFGTELASSRITVTYTGVTIAGTPTLSLITSVSDDNVSYTQIGSTDSFATNFRYVKVRLTVTDVTLKTVYRLTSLDVKLDAKLINDANTVSAISTDTNGTIANFSKEFIDVSSITVSANGTTPLTAIYNFKDSNIICSYSITTNVCTITTSGSPAPAHDLIAGQKVRLSFSSGGGIDGVYTVASVINNSQFTVPMVTANTSGNVSMYPQGIRVYLFNSSGTRVNGDVSWSIKGY